jgi:4-amino-4-deoxy-L-arabinose transferase-like glycosyltransferase
MMDKMVSGWLRKTGGRRQSLDIVLSMSLVIAAFGFLYLYNLDGWLINDDEGSFLYQAWRITEGELPYRDFFTTRWPLFLYTAGGWMGLVGQSIVAIRSLPACLTLATGVLVFLIGNRMLSPRPALLATVIFLLYPDVLRYGRSFQPEPFYLFLSILGLYLFIEGYVRGNSRLLSAAGLVFAIAALFKLIALLVLGGCVVYVAALSLRRRKLLRTAVIKGGSLLVPFAVVFGLIAGGFAFKIPAFYDSVVGVNLAQGQQLSLLETLSKGLAFLIACVISSPLVLLAVPAAWWGWRDRSPLGILSWQLPMALAFLLLSRDLFPRLLLFLVPSIAILVAASLEPVRQLAKRSLLLLSITCFLALPWLVNDFGLAIGREKSTLAVASQIQDLVPATGRVVSDYQELNFYANRRSTYLGAEISNVVVKGNSITGAEMAKEIQADGVTLVIIDVGPETGTHLASLHDYDYFHAFLQEHFVLLDTVSRDGQLLEVYYR